MVSQCSNDWQSNKETVLERNSHMFNNPLMSDIKFTCGEAKLNYLYAHKYVLATSSAVFYAMFYGGLPEKDSVHLADTDEESFEAFLCFLYTEACTMTEEIAIKVLYLAKKYIVPSLTEKCVIVLQESAQADNIFTVLKQALLFDQTELEKKCWEVVETQTRKVVASEAFCRISQETLIDILKRDGLSGIKEIELFKAVLKWSDAQCAKNGLQVTAENRRAAIGESLYQCRFLSMSEKEFAEYVSCSELLTAEEVNSIYGKFNGVESADLKWKQPDRRPLLKRFKRCNVEPYPFWENEGKRPDCMSFSVNKPVMLHGVYLFGDKNGSKYDVSLEVGDMKVSSTYTSECNSEGVYGFEVMLPTSISLDQNKVVTMAAIVRGPLSYYGRKGEESVEIDGVIVAFSNESNESSNDTDVTKGQFYEILLSTRG